MLNRMIRLEYLLNRMLEYILDQKLEYISNKLYNKIYILDRIDEIIEFLINKILKFILNY